MSAIPRLDPVAALAPQLGAPGIYRLPPAPAPAPPGVALDCCAFVGVAPRGPSRVPVEPETWDGSRALVEPDRPRRRSVAVPVESFDAYRRMFGGFEGPGRLPYAVAAFFEQGGRRAYVVRIVAPATDPLEAMAAAELAGIRTEVGGQPVRLDARNEGRWGNALRAALGFPSEIVVPLAWQASAPARLDFDPGQRLPAGSLLRLLFPSASARPPVWRTVADARVAGDPGRPETRLQVTLSSPLPEAPNRADLVTAELLLDDGTGLRERHAHLGLSPAHPRWMATVLYNESALVYPRNDWVDRTLQPLDPLRIPRPADLDGADVAAFTGGEDRWTAIVHDDLFDPLWTPAEPEPGDGVTALAHLADPAVLVVPDLYVPEALALPEPGQPPAPGSLAGAEFGPCAVTSPEPPIDTQPTPPWLPGLRLDPRLPADLAQITRLQARLVRFAEDLGSLVVLLDVPPGLPHRALLGWRAAFNSSYAAAYHPWPLISRPDDLRDQLIALPPSAAAAGIIAERELAVGISHGPANRLLAGALDLVEEVSPARHAELHPLGINCLVRERDGIRLTAARTLSLDPRWRQLTVRRLLLMLTRALEQQMQWAVFEPNGPALWLLVRQLLRNFLRRLYQGGAFRGASEAEAFFVRCDATLNDRRALDAGQMLAEVGVAPSEPLEFIVVRIVRGGDGTLTLEV
jgi:uncharacterized protein